MIAAGKGGRLIAAISDAGRVGESGLGAYSAAKAGATDLITFLASGASGWITGQTYPVNGGFSVNQ